MNKTVYAAIVERLKQAAAKEEVLPVEARVVGTVVRAMTDQEPTNDQERRERVEQLTFELMLLCQQVGMLDALGIASPTQQIAFQAASALMFGLDLARIVADAASPLDVSVIGA